MRQIIAYWTAYTSTGARASRAKPSEHVQDEHSNVTGGGSLNSLSFSLSRSLSVLRILRRIALKFMRRRSGFTLIYLNSQSVSVFSTNSQVDKKHIVSLYRESKTTGEQRILGRVWKISLKNFPQRTLDDRLESQTSRRSSLNVASQSVAFESRGAIN